MFTDYEHVRASIIRNCHIHFPIEKDIIVTVSCMKRGDECIYNGYVVGGQKRKTLAKAYAPTFGGVMHTLLQVTAVN